MMRTEDRQPYGPLQTPPQNNRAVALALSKNRERAERFKRIGQEISALKSAGIHAENDPHYKSAITPNPWRGLKSAGSTERTEQPVRGGPTVMQVDTRPGLCRRQGGIDLAGKADIYVNRKETN